MIIGVAMILSAIGGPTTPCSTPNVPIRGSSGTEYRSLYLSGSPYVAFRDAARRRVEAWHDHYARAEVSDALRTRLDALSGQWRLLVIAEDWCGDSANTIPYVAKLTDVAARVEMRIVNSDAGRFIMEAHRTMDGRAATPTILLLDENFEEAGCWVERPSRLDEWFQANKNVLSESDLYEQKYAWYAEDAGRDTLDEIVAVIEAAARGETVCRAQTD